MTTIAEINAQADALKRQADLASLAGIKAVRDALSAHDVAVLADTLESALPAIAASNSVAKLTTSVVSVLRNALKLISAEASRIEALEPPAE
jgi:hypothetical protein